MIQEEHRNIELNVLMQADYRQSKQVYLETRQAVQIQSHHTRDFEVLKDNYRR